MQPLIFLLKAVLLCWAVMFFGTRVTIFHRNYQVASRELERQAYLARLCEKDLQYRIKAASECTNYISMSATSPFLVAFEETAKQTHLCGPYPCREMLEMDLFERLASIGIIGSIIVLYYSCTTSTWFVRKLPRQTEYALEGGALGHQPPQRTSFPMLLADSPDIRSVHRRTPRAHHFQNSHTKRKTFNADYEEFASGESDASHDSERDITTNRLSCETEGVFVNTRGENWSPSY